jgi:hypothetical protein
MVWQEGVHCIVMATGLFENANVSRYVFIIRLCFVSGVLRVGCTYIEIDDATKMNYSLAELRLEGAIDGSF